MNLAEKLFVTDLDGTLLNSDGTISDYSVATLNRLLGNGLKITYATARSYYSASAVLRDVHFTLPCITHNGAYLSHAAGTVIKSHLLDPEIARDILLTGETMDLRPFVAGLDGEGRERILYRAPANAAHEVFVTERLRGGDRRMQNVTDPDIPATVIVMHYLYPHAELLPLKKYLDTHYGGVVNAKFMEDIYYPGYYGLEVYHRHADKSEMLRELCQDLDITPDNVVVFGDNLNDAGMFDFAGIGIAVANAHADLKARAQAMAAANTADGVVRCLESLFTTVDVSHEVAQ